MAAAETASCTCGCPQGHGSVCASGSDRSCATTLGTARPEYAFILAKWERKKDQTYRQILRLVPDHNDASDILQETACVVFDPSTKLPNPWAFDSWLKKVTNNKITDFFRSRHGNRLRCLEDLPADCLEALIEDGSYTDPNRVLERKEMLREAFALLSESDREILALRFMQFRYDEIAELLSIRESVVKSRLQRIRQTLLKNL
jgi:RNA polymerase sigma factor (sigma-70 family)